MSTTTGRFYPPAAIVRALEPITPACGTGGFLLAPQPQPWPLLPNPPFALPPSR